MMMNSDQDRVEIGAPVNSCPSVEEQKSEVDEHLTEAIDRLREVIAERPGGMIPYERMALQAIQRVEAECLNWKRAYGLLSREEFCRAAPAWVPRGGGDRIITIDPTVVDVAGHRALTDS